MGPLKSISPLHGLEEREWVSGKWDGCDGVLMRCVQQADKTGADCCPRHTSEIWGMTGTGNRCFFTTEWEGLAVSLTHPTLCSAAAATGAPGAGRISAFSIQEMSPTQDLGSANTEEHHAEVAQLLFQAMQLHWFGMSRARLGQCSTTPLLDLL